MENEKIVVRGFMTKNKTALIMVAVGVILLLSSFIFSIFIFYNWETFDEPIYYYGMKLTEGRWVTYYIHYYGDFAEFFSYEFLSLPFGYGMILGFLLSVIGVMIKVYTEKCSITVTDACILGKIGKFRGENEVKIPLNQITAIHKTCFNGVSVASIGRTSNFYCIENCEQVIKYIAGLLADGSSQPAETVKSDAESGASEIKHYKELLDAGVISQEEFDAKKKQLLGL